MAIPLLIPAIIAAAAAIAGGVTSIAAKNKAASAQKMLKDRRDDEHRRYLHELNTDYLDTSAAKSTLAALRKNNSKQQDAANNNAVKQGTSEEAKVALAGKLNEGYSDAASRLSGFGTQHKQQLTDSYLRRTDSLDNAIYNSQLGEANAINGIGSAIGGVAQAGLSAWGSGAFSKAISPTSSGMNVSGLTVPSSVYKSENAISDAVNYAQNNFTHRNEDVISYGRSIPTSR